jgi:hypothetical protein
MIQKRLIYIDYERLWFSRKARWTLRQQPTKLPSRYFQAKVRIDSRAKALRAALERGQMLGE